MAKPTLYGYFRSTKDLLPAIFQVDPRLLVFALLGMSNWVYKWYDPAGIWNADTVADGCIALVEPGYLAARSRPHDELARRLARVEREVRAAQGARERARRETRRG